MYSILSFVVVKVKDRTDQGVVRICDSRPQGKAGREIIPTSGPRRRLLLFFAFWGDGIGWGSFGTRKSPIIPLGLGLEIDTNEVLDWTGRWVLSALASSSQSVLSETSQPQRSQEMEMMARDSR